MKRNVSKEETLNLIKKIREAVPGIHLRTTLMVGHPGETKEAFQELLDFVRETRFERMGAFAYSEEEGTYSACHYEDEISAEEKQRRLDELMALQQEISSEIEEEKVGKVLLTVIDRKEGDYYIGRSEFCSPEVDPEILVPATRRLRVGTFYNVKITSSDAAGLKFKTNFGGTIIRCPVDGFTIILSSLFFTSNDPKPATDTLSPLSKAIDIASMTQRIHP